MLSSDRILALDIGASKIVLAEFSLKNTSMPELLRYGIGDLGMELDSDTDVTAYVVSTVRDLMREQGIKPAPLLMTLSGQAVFPRYVKLPPVGKDKIEQMIQYEAEQNVPFPINEVVWDYQLVGDASDGEQHVMLVAVKTENVREMTDCVLASGLEPEIVDAAPMALYNTVRFNYPDLDGCTMILDVGARSTNLVFIEQDRIFTRSIPVAGNTITSELAKSFQLSFKEAEELKREHAFVALGGVYSAGENEVAERVSKTVRNIVTRLHAEVNRSINFYRSQQDGNPPDRVLLTGGSSVIAHMDTFFREKLKVDVDYLNPFINVAVSERIDTEESASSLFLLGEVVGLALRRAMSCPVEINLMPPDLVQQKLFRKRLPFFGLSLLGVAAALVSWALHSRQLAGIYGDQQTHVEKRVAALLQQDKLLDKVTDEQQTVQGRADQLRKLAESRGAWSRVNHELLETKLPGTWMTRIDPVVDPVKGTVARIKLTGYGFEDALKSSAAVADGKTPTELMVQRFVASEMFAEGTYIVVERLEPERKMRYFEVMILLAEPIGAPREA